MQLAGNAGPKKSPAGHHPTTLLGYIFATKAHIDNRKKKLAKQQYLLHMSLQYSELRLTGDWDRFVCFGAPLQISTDFLSWQRYSTALQYLVSSKLCGVEQRSPPICGRAEHWPTFLVGIILCYSLFVYVCFCCVRCSFFSTTPRGWLERTSPPKYPIMCRVGCKTLTQLISVFLPVQFLQRAQCSDCKCCISYGNSVCPSVRHTPVLCQNGGT